MRSIFFILAILLHCDAASAATVVVERPLTRLAPTVLDLHKTCADPGDFDACTVFIAYRLDARCSPRDTVWRIDARATFRPRIRLYNIRQLPHEWLHINDVRQSVERYAVELEESEFASQDDCDAAALAASSGFEDNLREFCAPIERVAPSHGD